MKTVLSTSSLLGVLLTSLLFLVLSIATLPDEINAISGPAFGLIMLTGFTILYRWDFRRRARKR